MPDLLMQFWHEESGDYCLACQITVAEDIDIENKEVFLSQLSQKCVDLFRESHGPLAATVNLLRVEVVWTGFSNNNNNDVLPATSLRAMSAALFRRQLEMVRTRGFVDLLVVKFSVTDHRTAEPSFHHPLNNINSMSTQSSHVAHREFGHRPASFASMRGTDNVRPILEDSQPRPQPLGPADNMLSDSKLRFGPPLTVAELQERIGVTRHKTSTATAATASTTTTTTTTTAAAAGHGKPISDTEILQKNNNKSTNARTENGRRTTISGAPLPLKKILSEHPIGAPALSAPVEPRQRPPTTHRRSMNNSQPVNTPTTGGGGPQAATPNLSGSQVLQPSTHNRQIIRTKAASGKLRSHMDAHGLFSHNVTGGRLESLNPNHDIMEKSFHGECGRFQTMGAGPEAMGPREPDSDISMRDDSYHTLKDAGN